MGLAVLKLITLLIAVWGLNMQLKTVGSNWKNTNPELVKMDSLVIHRMDSLITTTILE